MSINFNVPKIGRGSCKEQAEACLITLNDWGLQNRVRQHCQQYWCGVQNRACTFSGNLLKQELAWVACRYHVMELPLAAVLFGPTGVLHVLPCSRASSKPG